MRECTVSTGHRWEVSASYPIGGQDASHPTRAFLRLDEKMPIFAARKRGASHLNLC